jgi:tRNA(His) 5'-end guanylyltransferase
MTDSLGDRMKGYENVSRYYLMRRTPAILRIDGKAFHTWTRDLEKPYSKMMASWMGSTMQYLVQNIQGAVFGYTQSDEISILLRDYDKLTTDSWFSSNIQKMVSVAASMATAHFNTVVSVTSDEPRPMALFDARIFNMPKEEVTNYFIWRQQDASRNSIQGLGQAKLGHKKCQGLNNNQVQDELMKLDPPINWNDVPTVFKRGLCVNSKSGELDTNIPIFTECREYVEIHIHPEIET